jgi:hypothetical protein
MRGLTAIVVLATLAVAYAWQRRGWESGRMATTSGYEWELQNPAEDPADAMEPGEFSFARYRYRSAGGRRRSSWGTDSNKAERIFLQGVRRLTRIHARSVEQVVDAADDSIYNYPWLYAVEVGYWYLDDEHAKRLRQYLDRGGFLMVDDFHGSYEWANFEANLRKVFPERVILDLGDTDQVFHTLYDLTDRFQIPGHYFVWSGRTYERDGVDPKWRAVLDEKGRVQVLICHNMDLGDAWEWADDPQYPEKFSSLAYRIALNGIVYAMTH